MFRFLFVFFSIVASSLSAQVIPFQTEFGNFCGYWRLLQNDRFVALPDCDQHMLPYPGHKDATPYYLGNCTSEVTVGAYQFEMKAHHSPIFLEFSDEALVTFAEDMIPSSTLVLGTDNNIATLTMNLRELTVVENGFSAWTIEYYAGSEIILDSSERNATICDGSKILLPYDSQWYLSLGGYNNVPLFVTNEGSLVPFDSTSVSTILNSKSDPVLLATVPVTITPNENATDIPWNLINLSRGDQTGTYTYRLSMTGQYRIAFRLGKTLFEVPFFVSEDCSPSVTLVEIAGTDAGFTISPDCSAIIR